MFGNGPIVYIKLTQAHSYQSHYSVRLSNIENRK